MVSLPVDQYAFMISRPSRLRMENVLDKSCRKIRNTRHMFDSGFPRWYHAVYEIMWKNVAEPERPQMAIWRMRIACWVAKITNTHSEYVMLTAFP